MAGDWVKIRVWLHRDPKLISMAGFLAGERSFMDWLTDPVRRTCDECAYEHVTRNVICHVTRSLLVTVWGVARERGRRDGDDLVVPHCDLAVLDEIAECPCFGEAMAFVGWAVEEESEGEPWRVRFPNFFAEEQPPHERHRERNAERQRRHRDRKRADGADGGAVESNVTSNVTVTPREEKSREEKSKKKPPLFCPPTADEVAAYCRERGNHVDAEAFVAHYQSNGWKVGKNPMKDWRAAVRTWEKNNFRHNGTGKATDLFAGARAFLEGGPLS